LINSLKEKEAFVAGVKRRNAAYYGDVDVDDNSVEYTNRYGDSVKLETFKGKKR
jgi:hypothetical protein